MEEAVTKPKPTIDAEYVDKLDKWRGVMSFKKSPHMQKICTLPHKIIGVFAGNQGGKCTTITTKISTPKGEIAMGDLYADNRPFDVYAWDGKQKVVARALPPFKKQAKEPCVRVWMSDCRWFEPALGHRVLTFYGWRRISELLCEFFQVPLGSNSEHDLLARAGDALHYFGTQSSFLGHCSQGYHQCDEQPLFYLTDDQAHPPLPTGALQHSSRWFCSDDRENRCICSDQTTSHLPSSRGVGRQTSDQSFASGYCASCTSAPPLMCEHPSSQQPCVAEGSGPLSDTEGHQRQSFSSRTYTPPFVYTGYNQAMAFNLIGCQEVFDFEVPIYHNYIAGGVVHHNTANAAFSYVMRIIGQHPVAEKNRLAKNIRCLSSSLPESSDAEEQDNTQYLELKKMLPAELIIKDITARSKTMVVASPTHGKSYFEFMSTKQELQDTGKVQRDSLWEDEEPPKPYREESRRRLLTRGGDEIITLTPINGLSYLYDDVWNKKSYIWRSDAIVEALKFPKEEYFKEGDGNIACVQIATDDNPIMTKDMVDMNFASEDEAEILVRRYGVFKQIAGRVHKSFNDSIHVIDYNKYFPNDIPYDWTHSRGIDYHESRIPWSIGWLSISPDDEWFVWQEFHPAIDGPRAMNTWEIAKSIVRRSGDYYYLVNLIDPLANKKQANTLFSVTDDLNRHFEQLRSEHGLGTQTYWEGWDTKDTKGYNEIRARMKNSLQVGRPFNNKYREHGEERTLPTIWFCNVPKFVQSIKLWSFEEWATPQSRAVNDPKPKRQERHSHDNMVLEAWAKDQRLRNFKWAFSTKPMMGHFSRTGRPIRSANFGVH